MATITEPPEPPDLKKPSSSSSYPIHPRGVSVYWLSIIGFLEELEDYGKNPSSKICEIEDVRRGNGIKRQRGQDISVRVL